jgi:hypothetical protein
MKKARHPLVEHFSKSNQQFEKLKEQQRIMESYNGEKAVGMVVEVFTCWRSTYSICHRLIYLQPALAAMAADRKLAD